MMKDYAIKVASLENRVSTIMQESSKQSTSPLNRLYWRALRSAGYLKSMEKYGTLLCMTEAKRPATARTATVQIGVKINMYRGDWR